MEIFKKCGVKLPDGGVEIIPFSYLYPAYLYLPEELISKGEKGFCDLDRNPRRLVKDPVQRKYLSEPWFYKFMINAYAFFAWPFIEGNVSYMEIYSGYDPIWQIAHNIEMWIEQMTLDGFIPHAYELFTRYDTDMGFPSVDEMYAAMAYIVPRAIDRCNLRSTIRVVREFRCFEDYTDTLSNEKMDFHRKWYHTRTKHPQISLEGYMDDYEERNDGMDVDFENPAYNFEDKIISDIDVDRFANSLSERDRKILTLRMENVTYDKIAKEVGYANHSAVVKRIKRIGEKYQKFTGDDLGF